MAQSEALKNLFRELQTTADNAVHILQQIDREWQEGTEVAEALRGSTLFSAIAKVMDEKSSEWQNSFPLFIEQLVDKAYQYRNEEDIFSNAQIKLLVSAFRKYVLSGCWAAMYSFFLLAGFADSKQILLEDEQLYSILKKEIARPFVIRFFINCASLSFDPWKQKMMEDKEFIHSLLELSSGDAWNLLKSLSFHPEAKVLMPTEVISKAGKTPSFACTNIYALLCSDKDLKALELDSAYLDLQMKLLESMITTGNATHDNVQQSLYGLLLPISNLSSADPCKDKLGEKAIRLLLSVITDKLPDAPYISGNLLNSRIEASQALWNLAYLKANCNRIKFEHGIERLKKMKAETGDATLKRNIEGILYMCTILSPEQSVARDNAQKASPAGSVSKGHVMISYNWDNQPTVKRIAQALKDQGYNVWLDLEKMSGSTLEAMAHAVEQSELVLICMSQKYKDSPNCRLEGEYCVNRKVSFVPLMMQKGYAPDGWLGIVLGSKLWYDFSNDENWEAKVAGLVKAIGDRGKKRDSQSHPTDSPSQTVKPHAKQVIDWTEEDILHWMKTEHISHLFETFKKHKITGRALAELKALHASHYHSFFFEGISLKEMCKEMGIVEYGDVLCLSAAIRKLN